jgi:membrane fusion protein, multidrug efflux system
VVITQIQPIAVLFSLPQQQITRANAAAAKGTLTVDVFGNDGVTVVDTGTLTGIDNQVDQTTGTVKLKAEFPNPKYQLWPGQFVNVRLKVDTLKDAMVVPTSAVQRGPAGTFSYVVGEDDVAKAVPVTVTQQNELSAVIAKGLSATDRVVTTGFANLSDGAKVSIGTDTGEPTPDLAPRKRGGSKGGDAGERRSKRGQGQERGSDGNPSAPMGQTAPAAGQGAGQRSGQGSEPTNAPQGTKQP